MKRFIFYCLCLWGSMNTTAQVVSNVVAKQVGKKITITYDLDKTSNISLYYSIDGGKTYSSSLYQVSGDVGDKISAGHNTIIWDVLKEVNKLVCSKLVFKVVPSNSVSSSNSKYVDLGLSVKWGIYNVGAMKPEEFGNYYAWGETVTKKTYDWSTYLYSEGSFDLITKYCINIDNGNVDGKERLEYDDDVASKNLGSRWRIPTETEWRELLQKCNWTLETLNGIKGYRIRSKSPNYSGSIFIPLAGNINKSEIYNVNAYGLYWSSTLYKEDSNLSWCLQLAPGSISLNYQGRFNGHSIRPVYK